jgi:signal transduction histidine kinase
MLRLWVVFQLIVLFVAWQYRLRWVVAGALALCLLDSALSVPFVNREGALFPLYLVTAASRLAAVTSVGLALGLLMSRQRQQRAALAAANRQLAQYAVATEQLAASQERNRLARELHDTLAHSMSGVTVQLEAVEALWDVNAAGARRMLEQALAATRSGLTEARRALQALRASPLADLGLPLAVTSLAESAAARANLALELDVDNQVRTLAPHVEQSVYRVAQEALTNVARHAQAKALRVALLQRDGEVSLTVADDGRGFDVARVNGAHYGLRGLRERAEMVGAALQVESAPQRGTTIRFVVPSMNTTGAADR